MYILAGLATVQSAYCFCMYGVETLYNIWSVHLQCTAGLFGDLWSYPTAKLIPFVADETSTKGKTERARIQCGPGRESDTSRATRTQSSEYAYLYLNFYLLPWTCMYGHLKKATYCTCIVNPQYTCARVTVLGWSVCLSGFNLTSGVTIWPTNATGYLTCSKEPYLWTVSSENASFQR